MLKLADFGSTGSPYRSTIGRRRDYAILAAVTRFYAFNGDADGLCALRQLALAEGLPRDGRMISGPKRRTALLRDVEVAPGDAVTVLDVSLAVNRKDVQRLLEAGAVVRYFDHHHPGEPIEHPHLELHVDTDPRTCTSLIVDHYLDGGHRRWAVAGAFGDNLADAALRSARDSRASAVDIEALRRLGLALNYNSYGDHECELLIGPCELYERLRVHEDPLGFVREDALFERLWSRLQDDLALAKAVGAQAESEHASLYVMPDTPWTRRVSGIWANFLAEVAPAKAHAILVPNASQGYIVSVRAPLARCFGAAELCLRFPSGGGREGAAGINHLPRHEVERFNALFMTHFSP